MPAPRQNERWQLYTSGGRVLGVTARGKDLPDAVERAYDAVDEDSLRRYALPQQTSLRVG